MNIRIQNICGYIVFYIQINIRLTSLCLSTGSAQRAFVGRPLSFTFQFLISTLVWCPFASLCRLAVYLYGAVAACTSSSYSSGCSSASTFFRFVLHFLLSLFLFHTFTCIPDSQIVYAH